MCLPPYRGLLDPGPSQQGPVLQLGYRFQFGEAGRRTQQSPPSRTSHQTTTGSQLRYCTAARRALRFTETSGRAPVSGDPGTEAAGRGDVEVSVCGPQSSPRIIALTVSL